MLVLSRFTLFFLMLGSLLTYFFINIKHIGEGSSSLPILAFSILLGFFLIVLEIVLKQNIEIKKSFLFLILFFTYFIVNVTLDRPSDLKEFLLGTTAGIFLSYVLGCLVSINLIHIKEKILKYNYYLKLFNFLYVVFSLIFLIFIIDIYNDFSSNLQENLFLISNIQEMFVSQRGGSFLSICFFIYSFITSFFLFSNHYIKKSKFSKTFNFTIFVFYCFVCIKGMLISQMIGSNNTLVNIGGLLFAAIVFFIFITFVKTRSLLENTKFNIRKLLLSKLNKKLFISIVIAFFILLFLAIILISNLNINLEKFRIFGFGSGEMTSVSSRLELWKNFSSHFGYNPIFGNMAVDALTTGEGTYVHSFIATLLTHLGIVGFIFFFIYLSVAIKEKLKSSNNLYVNNLFALYSLIVFAEIFAIASFGTFITWIPLWFLLGLIFPPIVFKNRKELNFEKSNINSIK